MTASPSSLVVRGPGRPDRYLDSHGKRVPSVTTITGARKTGIEGLLVWANRLGQDGKDHREERQKAADAGSLAHDMVHNAIHGQNPMYGIACPDEGILAQARTGFEAFCEWQTLLDLTYLATETPMVSDEYQYGGTPDAIARDKDGRVMLLDWKSSNRVYGDYIIQLAAYRHLWDEKKPEQRIESSYILRFGKDHGDFHFHSYPKDIVDMGWQAFIHLRGLYEIDKKLGKVAS